MAIPSIGLLSQADGATNINTLLTQEANRIGNDIHAQILHTSPWIDLIKKGAFPSDMGYQLNTIIYDRSLPIIPSNSSLSSGSVGLSWTPLGTSETGPRTGFLASPAVKDVLGPQDGKSFVDFTRILRQYSLSRAVVESPRINIEDLRFAAHRQEQLRAIMDLMKQSTRYSWEERYRDEYDKVADNIVVCKSSGTAIVSGKSGTATVDIADLGDTGKATANISNAVLDKVFFRSIRDGAGLNAYGRENGRPVLGLVLSSEASYSLMTEAGFRDDFRYNSSKVSELLAPLGIERSQRGFYHLIDDLAPRFIADSDDTEVGDNIDKNLNRVPAYTINATGENNAAVIVPNSAYDTATYEAAYVLHEEVMEALIPAPVSGVAGLSFNPVTYKGDFKWSNIPNEVTNPDGTIGFFRGILASASKPIKVNYGYRIIFDRTSSTRAS